MAPPVKKGQTGAPKKLVLYGADKFAHPNSDAHPSSGKKNKSKDTSGLGKHQHMGRMAAAGGSNGSSIDRVETPTPRQGRRRRARASSGIYCFLEPELIVEVETPAKKVKEAKKAVVPKKHEEIKPEVTSSAKKAKKAKKANKPVAPEKLEEIKPEVVSPAKKVKKAKKAKKAITPKKHEEIKPNPAPTHADNYEQHPRGMDLDDLDAASMEVHVRTSIRHGKKQRAKKQEVGCCIDPDPKQEKKPAVSGRTPSETDATLATISAFSYFNSAQKKKNGESASHTLTAEKQEPSILLTEKGVEALRDRIRHRKILSFHLDPKEPEWKGFSD